MAIFYTDIAAAQQQGVNFPGEPGVNQLINPPTQQNNPLLEGVNEIVATYQVSSGATEAVGDIINIALLPAGVIVNPRGSVQTGLTAPAATLTLGIGDNDLGVPTARPIPNAAAFNGGNPSSPVEVAPVWVSGTTYAPGNVVQDSAASSGIFVTGDTYICVAATSGATAPHSAATTVWYPCYNRYSTSIGVSGASANVSFASAIQFYGGPASLLPYSVTPGQAALGLTAQQILNSQYQIQRDCWLQARVLTVGSLVANTILVFRVNLINSN